ncbi:transglutaminase-like cysteine peptidase [Magnetospira sp. QH-2]|uniref:transglutaminase-like cysteine peptidase n=1 Tax=Magnetospira sp. (strain QH-2) TaxID=1288970 RepID=UPI0003E81555|nr:transglutaminase-like cysteine peptidase [Magnetospira sp. QH-2]CCQ72107.1 conserved periplasmic protein of unknown function [Magnetospira sp. QH-2]
MMRVLFAAWIGLALLAGPGIMTSSAEAAAAEATKKTVTKKKTSDKSKKKWARAKPGVFKSKEIKSTNFKPFKKWRAAMDRYIKQAKKKEGPCTATKLNGCHYKHWMDYLEKIKSLDKMTQIKKVNRYMNQRRYITDPKNWGKKDFWATPGEFLDKRGDCEDYSIAKYMSLKKLGFDEMSLRIIAVKDQNLKVGHAILGVYLDGKIYILDNQVKQVTEDKSIRHYKPVFSINEKAWWRHRG